MNRSVMAEGSQLLKIAAEPTLQLAAATRTPVASLQRRSNAHGQCSSNALDPLESSSAPQEGLKRQLLHVSGKLHCNMVSAALFIVNTLSTHQLAVCLSHATRATRLSLAWQTCRTSACSSGSRPCCRP
jgi:hypothetical protein